MTGTERRSRTEQPRRLLCFSAAFCAPCFVFALAGELGSANTLALTAACAAVLQALWLIRSRRADMVTAGLCVGVVFSVLFSLVVLRPPQQWDGKGAVLSVELTERAVGYATYGTARGNLLSINGSPARGSVWVYLTDGSPDLAPGNVITFTGLVQQSTRKPDGVFWTARQTQPLQLDTESRPSLRARLSLWSEAVGRRVDALLEGDNAGLLKALICGDKQGMSSELRSALSVSGLSHIAAVSGMHLSVLAGFVCALLGKRLGSAAAVPLILLYAGLTGFSPSVMRAAVMWLMAIGAFFARRENDSLTALCTALMVLAAANPFSLLSPSLLLSFTATLGILLFSPAVLSSLPKIKGRGIAAKIGRYVTQCTAVSIAASVSVLPVTAVFFTRISVLSVLSSLLVLWAVSLAMTLGIAVLGLSLLWPSGAAAAAHWILSPVLAYITGAARVLGGNPALTAGAENPYVLLVLAVLLAVLVVLRWRREQTARVLPAAAALTALCLLLSQAESCAVSRIAILDTGESAVLLVQSAGTVGVVNCGLSAAGMNARRVEDNLYRWGYGGADELLVSAPAARAGGGVRELCEAVPILHSLAPSGSSAEPWVDAVYEGSGCLQWGCARVERIALSGQSCAVRVMLPYLTVLDLTQTAAVDYVTCENGAALTGDVVIVRDDFLQEEPACRLLLHNTGCQAVVCADSGYMPVSEHSLEGVDVYSLSQRERIELKSLNWRVK